MKYKMLIHLSLSWFLFSCSPIKSQELNNQSSNKTEEFEAYWYAGKAEINRYELSQSRYGEQHKGESILIFVTEDFLSDKQVKYEFGDQSNAIPILKLNAVKKFFTGIYPYSLMHSVFSPIDNPANAIKLTGSMQEWCGQTFTQLNSKGKQYQGTSFSYFQSEGDEKFSIKNEILEDEIWNMIRINPDLIPEGGVKVFPSIEYFRFEHQEYAILNANIQITAHQSDEFPNQQIRKLELNYKNIARSLRIYFTSSFPYEIMGWDLVNNRGQTTTARRTNISKRAYWGENAVSDASLREAIGLDAGNY